MNPFDYQTLLFSYTLAAEFLGKFGWVIKGNAPATLLVIGAIIHFWIKGLRRLIWLKNQGKVRASINQNISLLGFLTMLMWALGSLVWVLVTVEIKKEANRETPRELDRREV